MSASSRLVKKWMREQKRRRLSDKIRRQKLWETWRFLVWRVVVLMMAACLLPVMTMLE